MMNNDTNFIYDAIATDSVIRIVATDTTAEYTLSVAFKGVSQIDDIYSRWFMNDFNFTTTANKALVFDDMSYDLFILVQGYNKIEVNCTVLY